jgi:hypothetical protein
MGGIFLERIVKNWESAIGYIIFFGYVIYCDFNTDGNVTYLYYFLIWLGYILITMNEVLLDRRIDKEKVEKLYYPRSKKLIIRIPLILLCHIIFWVITYWGLNNIIAMLILSMSLFIVPTSNYSAIFETKEYFICSGTKYYYNRIESFKDDFGYQVIVNIDGKEKTITCGRAKKYDKVVEMLEKHFNRE